MLKVWLCNIDGRVQVYYMILQILESKEEWHWENKANVGGYAPMEEGIRRGHHHGGISSDR